MRQHRPHAPGRDRAPDALVRRPGHRLRRPLERGDRGWAVLGDGGRCRPDAGTLSDRNPLLRNRRAVRPDRIAPAARVRLAPGGRRRPTRAPGGRSRRVLDDGRLSPCRRRRRHERSDSFSGVGGAGSVDRHHLGSASDLNGAPARTAGLVVTALPGFVLSAVGVALLRAFHLAKGLAAVACVAAAACAFALVPLRPRPPPPA